MKPLFSYLHEDSAVTALEYALLASLLAVALMIAISLLGDQIKLLFIYVRDQVVLALS